MCNSTQFQINLTSTVILEASDPQELSKATKEGD